ncbi:hypothetical protein PQQ65_18020 [Paraburkholderia strydomiana]|uniref:hypothetical protein n=1 Tax=Paraburkholderia strydomiana TaxID=1245417 RepID=UPI0038BA47D2
MLLTPPRFNPRCYRAGGANSDRNGRIALKRRDAALFTIIRDHPASFTAARPTHRAARGAKLAFPDPGSLADE